MNEAAKKEAIQFRLTHVGKNAGGAPRLIWGHGWGHSSASFAPLAQTFAGIYPSTLIDFPGFGGLPPPPEEYGTAEIADAASTEIRAMEASRRIWIGHSFGGRIGLQLAARHPDLFDGLVLISAAGLRRKRSFRQELAFRSRLFAFKTARAVTPEGPAREKLRRYFGSQDYKTAGPLRPLLVRVVGEDLTDAAAQVACPARLIYGAEDKETPPEIGERLHKLIKRSELFVMDRYDHNTILTDGRHQLANSIREFVAELSP